MGKRLTKVVYVQDEVKIKDLEWQLRECARNEEGLERKRKDEIAERKEIREANEKMVRSVMDRMNENDAIHDEEMTRARVEFNEKKEKLKEEQAKDLNKNEADHKVQMMKLEVEFKATQADLEKKLEKSKQEGNEKIKSLEDENENLKLKGFEALDAQREGIKKQQIECQKEIKQVREHMGALRDQMFEEERTHRNTEHKKTMELANNLTNDLKQQFAIEATVKMIKEYYKILDTIENTGERLKEIQISCAGEITEDSNCDTKFYLEDTTRSKNDFKIQVKRFKQLAINNSNAHQEVVQLCKSYLNKFDGLVDGTNFMTLCVQLPNALKNNDEKKIRMLAGHAGNLSIELSKNRLEVTDEIDRVTSQNPALLQIQI